MNTPTMFTCKIKMNMSKTFTWRNQKEHTNKVLHAYIKPNNKKVNNNKYKWKYQKYLYAEIKNSALKKWLHT